MNKTHLLIALGAVVILGAVLMASQNLRTDSEIQNSTIEPNSENINQNQEDIKEFEMTSFYEIIDGKTKPQYSLKEMTVKKGETVRIKVTVTKGSHDFVLDEYNIRKETPLNETVVFEFTADKAGEFVYYCSKPGHRENGHWGTLKVVE